MKPARVSRFSAGDVSHLQSLVRFIRARLAAGGGHQAFPSERPQLLVEGMRVAPRRLRRYLDATGGGSVVESPLLPPALPSVWETALALDLLRLGGYPFPSRGLLHVGTERVVIRSASASESLDLHLALGDPQLTRGGTRVGITGELRNRRGQPCQRSETMLLIRGLDPLIESPPRGAGEGAEGSGFEPIAHWMIPRSAGRRYARASGDFNPIHLSGWTARRLGLPGTVLHGGCIEAMVAHELIRRRCGGDPTRLRQMEIRFLAPVVLPAAVVLEMNDQREFRVVGGESTPLVAGRFLASGW